jgi:hypothetical protein
MARKSLDQMLADLLTSFPDQNTKFITPAILRQYLDDLIKAIRPSYAWLFIATPPVPQAVTTAAAPLVFTSSEISFSQGEYTANPVVGRVTRLDPGTTEFSFTADVSSPSNSPRTLTFTLYKNGIPAVFRQSVVFSVAGEVISVTFNAIQYNNVAANYDMYVSSNVNETFSFSEVVFLARTVPVNNYT